MLCEEDFDDDPDKIAEPSLSTSHLPIKSSKCKHMICMSCVYGTMAGKMEMNRNNKPIKWLDCPYCKVKTCFNTENPIVDENFCQALQVIRNHVGAPQPPSVGCSESTATESVENTQSIHDTPVVLKSSMGMPAKDEMSSMVKQMGHNNNSNSSKSAEDEENVDEEGGEKEEVTKTMISTQDSISTDELCNGDDESRFSAGCNEVPKNDIIKKGKKKGNCEVPKEIANKIEKKEEQVQRGLLEIELDESERKAFWVRGVEETKSVSSNTTTQVITLGAKVSKDFFDDKIGKMRPFAGEVQAFGECV